jgi:hypothetical protein
VIEMLTKSGRVIAHAKLSDFFFFSGSKLFVVKKKNLQVRSQVSLRLAKQNPGYCSIDSAVVFELAAAETSCRKGTRRCPIRP